MWAVSMSADLSNPFPGMNPWLVLHWHSVHASFITAESFDTFCRMIFPALNFTVARAGMTKLLPG